LTRVQAQSADLNNAIQQTGAFAFAILALYISVLSLIATVMFGLLPMIR
jgi:hypothetical protein